MYARGSSIRGVNVKSKRKDLNAGLDKKLAKRGIPATSEPIYRATASAYLKAIRRAQLSNRNGWMVDAYTKDEYKGMKLYLTRSGNAGVAIKRNGDVVSLFAKGGKGNMAKLIPFAVANGGRKLDAYAMRSPTGLQNQYARFGAKATGRVAFNPDYAPNLWQMKSEEFKADPANRPDVVAMTLPKSLGALIRAYDGDRKINLDKVRMYDDYGDMLAARDAVLDGRADALKAAMGGGR